MFISFYGSPTLPLLQATCVEMSPGFFKDCDTLWVPYGVVPLGPVLEFLGTGECGFIAEPEELEDISVDFSYEDTWSPCVSTSEIHREVYCPEGEVDLFKEVLYTLRASGIEP